MLLLPLADEGVRHTEIIMNAQVTRIKFDQGLTRISITTKTVAAHAKHVSACTCWTQCKVWAPQMRAK